MRRRALFCLLFIGCPKSAAVSPPSTPVASEQEEFAALLTSIPPLCAANAPLDVVVCPAPQPDPEGACVVERFDTRSNRLTDRLVYVGTQLVREEQVASAHTRADSSLTYDSSNRLVEKTVCLAAGQGEPEWSPSWRPPMAVYEEPYAQQNRTVIFYEGDAGVPRFARIDSTSGDAGYRMKLCYAYDLAGRRSRRFQTYRTEIPGALQVQVRSYAYADAGLASIDVRDVALKGSAVARGTSWRATFIYNASGRLTGMGSSGHITPLGYDAQGHLINYGDITFDRNDAGQTLGFHPGDDALDGTFEWDATGRIRSATFKSGDGYRVTYGKTCVSGFSPPPVTPDVDGYLFYEGKDEL